MAASERDGDAARWTIIVSGRGAIGMDTVDALARLRLAAARHAGRIHITSAGCDLAGLVRLAGLTGVVPVDDGLALEPGRQPEPREQPGVEEVMDVGDPPG